MMRFPHPLRGLVVTLAMSFVLGASSGAVDTARAANASSSPSSAKNSSPRTLRDLSDPLLLRGLEWRAIGPYRGGRVVAVTGVPGQANVFYFGGTGGGVWKSTDAGLRWTPMSDGQLATGSVGAIAVAPSDPNVVYAGMGEGCIRGNLSEGDGVYRSVDAGRTWTHLGLTDTRQIGRVRVHPRDPDLVYVAALGHAFGANHERGVFRSKDGGVTWKNVLFVNDSTGAIDLAMDTTNPRVLYATTWQVYRSPWSLESGGRGSGLWKTTDGGDTWKRLVGSGLPKGLWGRAGVAVSPANPDRVWAVIEADDGGVFRSDDAGRSWTRVNEERNLRQRAWYYTHVFADPKNPDVMWVLNVQCLRSRDGGRTFTPVATPHGDNHDLWLDPDDPRRLIEGNDGGATVSLDGGANWSSLNSQPTAQFYHVATDDDFPYRVFGAQQDNTSVAIASRTSGFGIDQRDWYDAGGCESGYVAPRPGAPGVDYAGCYDGFVGRYDHRLQVERNVSPWPENPMGWGAEGMKYRFQWTFPILVSSHDPHTVYAGANVLFRSTDEGQSWSVISPDLTRNDPGKLGPSGGPITKDNTSIEYYCTIFAVAESPRDAQVLWTGSDDGRVHVTRDGGAHWSDVTPRDLPAWATVNQIDASAHDTGTAYVCAHRYRLGDDRPYAWVTHDFGRSWGGIARGLPQSSFVRVVREDPRRKGLLYAGTETGIFFSLDAGARWTPLKLASPGALDAFKDAARRAATAARPESAATLADEDARGMLPVVPVTDLVIKDDDLVISTQGRAFWILDDVNPLRELSPAVLAKDVHLFAPAPAYLYGGPPGPAGTGRNPPRGATISYLLARDASERDSVTLEFMDTTGAVVRRFTSRPAPPRDDDGTPPPRVSATAGINRFTWDLREQEASRFKGMILWGGDLRGPEVVPGRYRVRLTAFGRSETRDLEVRGDPRTGATADDLARRYDYRRGIRDELTRTHDAIVRLRDVRDQVQAVAARAKSATRDTTIARAAKALADSLSRVEEALYQTKNKSSQDPLNYPIQLNNKLAALAGTVEGVDAPPTDAAVAVYRDLAARIEAQLTRLDAMLGPQLDRFNALVRDQGVPAVVVKGRKNFSPLP